jgi:hypothetical protein
MTIGWGRHKRAHGVVGRLNRIFGRRKDEGGALVEFAMTLPLMIMVLMGTVSFSMGIYILQQVQNATSSGALWLGGEAGQITDPCATLGAQIAGTLPTLTQSNITFWVYVTTPTTSGSTSTPYGPFSPPSAGTCKAAGNGGGTTEETEGYPVTVKISYSYSWFPYLSPNSSNGWIFTSTTSNLTATQTVIAQ